MKYLLILSLILMTMVSYGQNLTFTSGTCVSQDSITIDLGVDGSIITSDYESGDETRAIAFLMQGTWTNDSLQVYAAVNEDSTYYPVYFNGAVVYEIATTGNSYIVFDPRLYAGIRYLMFVMPADEGDTRIYWIVRRKY